MESSMFENLQKKVEKLEADAASAKKAESLAGVAADKAYQASKEVNDLKEEVEKIKTYAIIGFVTFCLGSWFFGGSSKHSS